VGGIADATFEITAAEMTFCLHMSDNRLDRGAPSELEQRGISLAPGGVALLVW